MKKHHFNQVILMSILVFVFCMFGFVHSAAAAVGDITTVAGTGQADFSGDGGTATQATLNNPFDVFVDSSGNLFIVDFRNHRIRRMDGRTGIITTVAGTGEKGFSGDGGPATLAMLNSPTGVFVDVAGNLFIVDRDNDRIRRVDAQTGTITTVAGMGERGFSGDGEPATEARLFSPYRVFVDSFDNLFIADTINHRIRRVDGQTGIITTIAGTGKIDFSGDGGKAIEATIKSPQGLFVDSSGNLFISDTNFRVRRVDGRTGIITTVAGIGEQGFSGDEGPATEAKINNPLGIFVDAAGNLFIADGQNHRIRRVDGQTGIITTVAGTGKQGFSGDRGKATEARLSYPSSVFVDLKGNLFITDQVNNRIRRVEGIAAPTVLGGEAAPPPTADTTPPVITTSSPKDGQIRLDPDALNRDGIVITFDEAIDTTKVQIKVEVDRGPTLDWQPVWSDGDTKLTLTPTAGNELTFEAAYRVTISQVTDTAGNVGKNVEIMFATKAAPEEIPPPTVTSISPDSGPTDGGTAITITGANFVAGAQVTIGGVEATDVVVVSDTEITAKTPPGTAGAKNALVINPDKQTANLIGGFTYTTPLLTTAVLAVGGVVRLDDGTPVDGLEVVVTNKATDKTQRDSTGSEDIKGGYQVAFIDTETNRAAAEGDEIVVTVIREGKTAGTMTRKLTSDDITNASAVINLTIKPLEVVPPPILWRIVIYGPDAAGNLYIRGAKGAVLGGSLIRIIYLDGSTTTIRAHADGSFFIIISAKLAGDSFNLIVIDAQGRESKAIRISTKVIRIPTELIKISAPDVSGRVTISGGAGTVAGGSILRFIYASGAVITVTANADGSFSHVADAKGLGASFYLIVMDAEGKVLSSTYISTGASATGMFFVTGTVRNPDGFLARDGLKVTVTNQTTNLSASDLTGQTAGAGKYLVRLEDAETNRAASVGDVIEITVTDADKTLAKVQYTLTQAAIETLSLVVADLRLGLPTLTAISPNTAPTAGGTEVTLTGANFVSGAKVTIDGKEATDVVVVSATQITAKTPEGTAGAQDAVVTNPDGQSAKMTGGFTYVTPLPSIAAIVVEGIVSLPDGAPAPDGLEVVVTNQTTDKTERALTGEEAPRGGYQVTLVDIETSRAAAVNDEIVVTVLRAGKTVGSTTHKVTAEEIEDAKAVIHVSVKLPVVAPVVWLIVISGPDASGNLFIRGAKGAVIGGGLIRIIYQDGSVVTARADTDGSFFFTVPANIAADSFDLIIIDAQGRESPAARISTTVPQISIELVSISSPDVAGKVTIDGKAGTVPGGSTLYFIYANGTVVTVIANPDGSFSLTADAAVLGAGFDIVATDAEGKVVASGHIRTSASQTGVFFVTGEVRNRDTSLARNGLSVTVTNLTTGVTLLDTTGETAGDGRYGVRFVDLIDNRAAAVGDVLKISVMVGDEAIGKQQYTLTQVDIDAFNLVIEAQIEKATFTLQLSEGINLISLPLAPKEGWRMSDLARFIGPKVKMIIFHRREGCTLVSYSPNDADDSIYNAPLTDNAAYIVVMDAPKTVTFTGVPWSGDVLLKECYNFIGVPLDPGAPWTLRDLSAFVGPNLDWIIVYDKVSERFVSYNPTALGEEAPGIRGGEGYILVMTAETQLKFSGKEWEKTPAAVAPLLATNRHNDSSELALVTVEGNIRRGDDGTALNDLELNLHNLTAGWNITNNERTVEDGRYRLTYADFENNRAIRVGDLLEVTVVDPNNAFGIEVIRRTVTLEDFKQERIMLGDIVILPVPKQSALLANYPNPFNPETWIPYKLSKESIVVIRIYNVSGQLIRTLSLGKKAAGIYARKSKAAYWDGRNDAGEWVSSGLYFYTLKAGDFKATRRMLIVK